MTPVHKFLLLEILSLEGKLWKNSGGRGSCQAAKPQAQDSERLGGSLARDNDQRNFFTASGVKV
jgi:hypothetical protein